MKYGRTYHLKSSPGATRDDKIIETVDHLYGHEVVVTEKMDGENTTINSTGCHARSEDSRYHPSRDWIKGFAASISPKIGTPDLKIVGEYLYARHSIVYEELPSYFLGFAVSVFDVFYDWPMTLAMFNYYGVEHVPTIYEGIFTSEKEREIINSMNFTKQEGFVVRRKDCFSRDEMNTHIAKYVRANHVTTDEHWMHKEIIKNDLK
jgi:hypothetical protein